MFRPQPTQGKNRFTRFLASFSSIVFAGLLMATSAHANANKVITVDNNDAAFTTSGFTASNYPSSAFSGVPIGEYAYSAPQSNGGTASATWSFGAFFSGNDTGTYSVEAYVPDDTGATSTDATYVFQQGSTTNCATAVYTTIGTFSGVNQNNFEGRWMPLGTVSVPPSLACFRLVLTNNSTTSTGTVWADAVRLTREFESLFTIPDMPRSSSAFAAGTTYITSATNATPTVIATLTYSCPASGTLVVSGSGESAAVSSNPSTANIGLAYSLSKDSTATDNTNVVQSSALAIYNGDANRDFLFVQRSDSCTADTSVTYRLTAYATSPSTKITGVSGGSFMWNGRITAQYTP